MTLGPTKLGGLTCLLVVVLVAVSLSAAEELRGPDSLPDESTRSGISVSVEPEVSEGYAITDPMTFHVAIENSTQDRFEVERILLTPPTAMRRIRATGGSLSDPLKLNVRAHKEVGELNLPSETRNDYTLHLDAALSGLMDPVTLFFLPGEYSLRYEVTFQDTEEQTFSIAGHEIIELTPPFHSVLRGGVLGALLLTVFLGSYRLQHWLKVGDFPDNALRLGLLSGAKLVLQFVVGSVVSFIVILLLNRSTDLPMPITVEVKDYMGGLLVGLFSYQLGDVIYKRLVIRNSEDGG